MFIERGYNDLCQNDGEEWGQFDKVLDNIFEDLAPGECKRKSVSLPATADKREPFDEMVYRIVNANLTLDFWKTLYADTSPMWRRIIQGPSPHEVSTLLLTPRQVVELRNNLEAPEACSEFLSTQELQPSRLIGMPWRSGSLFQ